jgi:signal transduction histidine kinase
MQQEVIIVIAAVIIVLLFLGVMFLLALFYFNTKKRRLLEENRRLESEFNEELLKTRIEIQEETFQTISQEIHDNIGQTLALLKLTLNATNPEDADKVTTMMFNSKQLVAQSIHDLRNLSHTLNPYFIETIGLPNAINQLVDQLNKTKKYLATVEVTGPPVKFPAKKELIIFRVIQELLNNIIKHAQATKITIQMNYRKEQLTIKLSDNGAGFDAGRVLHYGSGNGIGLSNIRNRIKLIEGKFKIDSTIGKGTTISLALNSSKT